MGIMESFERIAALAENSEVQIEREINCKIYSFESCRNALPSLERLAGTCVSFDRS